jgi:PKD repeat protein
LAGCDKATPVAPDGTVLSISANPTRIALNGTSTITVVGRKPDGNPLNPGTEIRFSATMGSIQSIATTDKTGTATAIFQSNGQLGTATITAETGSVTTGGGGGGMTSDSTGSSSGVSSASVTIQVGTVAGSIVLQPTPTTVTTTGGTIHLLATVRDANGSPLANQGVNFTSDYGTLNSRGGTVTTDANGQARDALHLTAADLQGNVATVTVMAQTVGGGSSGGTSLLSTTATIHVQGGPPHASFTYVQGSTDLTVDFNSTSTGGQGTLSYTWDFGDPTSSNNTSSDPDPVHVYSAAGTYTVRLVVIDTNNQASSVTTQIKVPVGTGGSSG